MDFVLLVEFLGAKNAVFVYGCICGFVFRMYVEFKSGKKIFSYDLGLPCVYVSNDTRPQYFHRYIDANKEKIHCVNLTREGLFKKNICTKTRKKCPYC